LDDRKLGPVEVERIREMWEMCCNRTLTKAGFSEFVNRQSLQAQDIKQAPTQHLGARATAMARNGCRPRKAEANWEILTASRRMAEVEYQLQHLKKDHAHRVPHKGSGRLEIHADAKPNLATKSHAHRSKPRRKTYWLAVHRESRVTYHGNRPPGNHSGPRLTHPDPARELARLLARGASIGRIAAGHHFRGGQLLVGLLRTLRAAMGNLQIEQGISARR
jgi:hypothetical protein